MKRLVLLIFCYMLSIPMSAENYQCDNVEMQYAVIIDGGYKKGKGTDRKNHWNDCSFIYKTLVDNYGYSKSNIYLIVNDGYTNSLGYGTDFDGDGVSESNLFAATEKNIYSVFGSLSQLDANANVLIFITGHADFEFGQYKLGLWNNEKMTSARLAYAVNQIPQECTTNIVLGCCKAKGFANDLQYWGNRVISFACNESQNAEAYGGYTVYLYHFTRALRGIDYNTSIRADSNEDGEITMNEVHDYIFNIYYNSNNYVHSETPGQISQPSPNLKNVLTLCNKGYECYNYYTLIPMLSEYVQSDAIVNTITHGYGTIKVKSGNTLTISSTLRMAPNSKIIVEKGAKLVVNGGTITSACNKYWEGVYIEGSRNLPQTESNQGVLELSNATVENADIAVTTIGNNYDWSKTGGIIKATNSVFRNNNKSVEFMSYYNIAANGDTLDNESYFTNCTFTWDTAMIEPEDSYINSHVTMWQVKAVDFTACTFKDERVYRPSPEHTTQGILTNESSYNIKANPMFVQDFNGNSIYFANPTRFNNLTYGIRTASAYTLPCNVERSEFNNNYCGIFATNTYALTATNNTFNLIPQQGYSGNWTDMQAIGISMQRSRHFTISNNDFMGQNKADKTAGIQIDNISFDVPLNQTVPALTSFDEVINNNRFNKVFIGIESLGQNYIQKNKNSAGSIIPTVPLYDGLTAKCNMFENAKYALYITKQTNTNSPAIVGGMKQNQGSSISPVNNEFSNTDTSIYNYDGINLTYWNNSSMFLPSYSSKVVVQTTNNSGNGCGAKGVTSEMPVIPPIFPPVVLNSLNNMNDGYTLPSDEQETADNQLWESYLKQYGNSYNIPTEILSELSEHETAVGLMATEMLYFKGVITNYHPTVIFNGKETTPDKKEVIAENDIVIIAPNPAKDNIVVSYNFADDGEYQFIILDSEGIVLMKEFLQGKAGEKLINLRNFESGIYFYKITDKDRTLKTDKLIIAR